MDKNRTILRSKAIKKIFASGVLSQFEFPAFAWSMCEQWTVGHWTAHKPVLSLELHSQAPEHVTTTIDQTARLNIFCTPGSHRIKQVEASTSTVWTAGPQLPELITNTTLDAGERTTLRVKERYLQ